MKLTWNIVARNIQPHAQLQSKLREKIAKLERHLQHFPPDAVHLQIGIDRHVRRPWFTASLTLRLPSNILHSSKSATDPVPAFDSAIKALLRELSGLKAALRREATWRRRDVGAAPVTAPLVFATEPMPAGQGPQTFADSVSALLQRYYPKLLAYVERHLERAQAEEDDLPTTAIDGRSVVAEVTRKALASAHRKPEEASYLLWFYMLAKQEVRRRLRALQDQEGRALHWEERQPLSLAFEQAEGYDSAQPRELVEQQFEPALADAAELVPDTHMASPDEELEHKDFLEYLQRATAAWPKLHRDLFELHFVEGFAPEEVALLEKLPLADTQSGLDAVQERLRQLVAAAASEGLPGFRPTVRSTDRSTDRRPGAASPGRVSRP